MATTFLKLFDPTQVGSTITTLYTVPSTPTTTLLRNARIRFANTTAGAVTIAAYAVPNGGAYGASNMFLPTYSIPANDYIDIDVPVMPYGAVLRAIAGAGTSITATCLDGFLQS